MLIFTKIAARNFMSFGEFDLAIPLSGLFQVVGDSGAGDFSDSNGAGKSSLWEALCWCLYGRTIRGVVGDEVARTTRPRGASCEATVNFTVEGESYYVTRSRFPTGLKLYHEVEGELYEISQPTMSGTEEKLREILGMTFSVFTNSVYFPQGLPYRFSQASDSEKKAVLDEILQIDWLQEARANVVRAQKEKRAAAPVIDVEISGLQHTAEAEQADVIRMETAADALIQECERLAGEQADLEDLRQKVATLEESIRENLSEKDRAQSQISQLRANRPAIEKSYFDVSRELSNLDSSLAAARRHARTCEEDIARKTERVGGPCPTCGQTVTEDGIAGALRELHVLLVEDRRLIEECEALWAVRNGQRTAFEEERRALDASLSELESSVRRFDQEHLRLSRSKESYGVALQSALSQETVIQTKLDEVERTRAVVSQKKLAINVALARVEVLNTTKRELTVALGDLDFWTEGFGNRGIKSMVLDSVVPQLNESAVFYSNMLTDGRIHVEFRSTSETKGGEVRDKLSVVVREYQAGESYSAVSGGEKRRADVVVLLSLYELISRRSQTEVNLLILDEVFEALDRTGMERLATLLQGFAQNKAVYVVSHSEALGDWFEETIRVSKLDGVSRLE